MVNSEYYSGTRSPASQPGTIIRNSPIASGDSAIADDTKTTCLSHTFAAHHNSELSSGSSFCVNLIIAPHNVHGYLSKIRRSDSKLLCWFDIRFIRLIVGNKLNRCSHLRQNNEYLSYVLQDPSTKFLALHNLDCLCDPVPHLLGKEVDSRKRVHWHICLMTT